MFYRCYISTMTSTTQHNSKTLALSIRCSILLPTLQPFRTLYINLKFLIDYCSANTMLKRLHRDEVSGPWLFAAGGFLYNCRQRIRPFAAAAILGSMTTNGYVGYLKYFSILLSGVSAHDKASSTVNSHGQVKVFTLSTYTLGKRKVLESIGKVGWLLTEFQCVSVCDNSLIQN